MYEPSFALPTSATTKISTLLGELLDIAQVAGDMLRRITNGNRASMVSALWEELRNTLEGVLRQTAGHIDSLMTNRVSGPPIHTVACEVCCDFAPSIALRPCVHTLCPDCAYRLYRCPFCREFTIGRLQIYFSG